MKGLLDIQTEIRRLETIVEELAGSLYDLDKEIQMNRDAGNILDMDYDTIRLLAKNVPFSKHPLRKLESEIGKKLYIEFLLNLTRIDDSGQEEKYIFIQWILDHSALEIPLEDLYTDCLKTNQKNFAEISVELNKEYQMFFITDALIVAYYNGQANGDVQAYIADLCTVLGMDVQALEYCAIIAKIVLLGGNYIPDRDIIMDIRKYIKKYQFYINNQYEQMLMIKMRKIALEIPDSGSKYGKVVKFRWIEKQYSSVHKNQIIAEFDASEYGWPKKENSYTIKASCSGMLFQFRDNNTYYGVISYEGDDKDSIKAWIKENKKNQ